MSALAPLHQRIAGYYSGKVRRHGATPMGVDWSCEPTQQLRFVQLLRIVDFTRPFSLDDLGCGYGALLSFVQRRHRGAQMDYLGIDVSPDMVSQAQALHARSPGSAFCVGSHSPRVADYSVASGIFNVRIDEPAALWHEMIATTLHGMAQATRIGFAVNFLATLPPGVAGKAELYRCTPQEWRSFCEALGMTVDVLAAYGMREFTLLARH